MTIMKTFFHAALIALSVSSAAAQRETPPAPGTPKDYKVPRSTTFTLENGMKVTMVPFGRVPKLNAELRVRTGVIDERPNDVSLSSVVADMLLEGTTARSAQDISRLAGSMGGSLGVVPGAEVALISGDALSEFGPQLIALIADVARNPSFAEADLKRILDKHSRDNAISMSQPGTIAQMKFREMMYGTHPFAKLIPTEEMLRSFTVQRVREFHSANYGAARAHLFISGVYDSKALEAAIRGGFESWAAGAAPTENPPILASRQQVAVVDRPNSVQSSIVMGLPAPHPTNPDWVRMNVTDYILGGAFGSRITSNIREDKGYTYSPGSFLWTRKGATIWRESADVTSSATGASLTEIFREIDRLRTEAPPEKELAGIKNNLAGIFVIQNSSRAGLISQLDFADMHGLGPDYLANYVKNIHAVTPEEVRMTAQKYIDPAKMSIAIVGDKKSIESQISKVKPIVP
jgi:predicted Zn-dependent peptidase